MEYSYVSRNLRRGLTYSHIRTDAVLSTEEARQNLSQQTAEIISSTGIESLFHESLKTILIKSKPAYTLKKTSALMALNLLNKNILKLYKVRPSNRENLVSLFVSHIKETYPYNIYRYDIKSFYESIDRKSLLKKLKDDNILSSKSVKILELFFKELERAEVKGLPRGISLSSTLSELYMRNFDSKISKLDDVLYYGRFVDDIIIITNSYLRQGVMSEHLTSIPLPARLEFHSKGEKKFVGIYPRATSSGDNTKKVTFSYLGYEFKVSTEKDQNEDFYNSKYRKIEIDISKDKVKKIKDRLIKSFARITSKKNAEGYDTLVKRIKFLTGNYFIEKIGYGKTVKSGIFYNYRHVNTHKNLKLLDLFLCHILFGNTPLSLRLKNQLSYSQRVKLSKNSFISGFEEVKFHRFKYSDFDEIRQCWK